MSKNEYLIETMTKIEAFNQWLDKYNNFDFGLGERYAAFLTTFALIVILFFFIMRSNQQDNAGENDKKENLPLHQIITIVLSVSLFVSAIAIYSSRQSKANNLKNETITLEEFQKYKPIDFDKFPEWVRDELAENGKLYYTSVRKAIEDQDYEKERMKKLEKIEKRKKIMNSMSL